MTVQTMVPPALYWANKALKLNTLNSPLKIVSLDGLPKEVTTEIGQMYDHAKILFPVELLRKVKITDYYMTAGNRKSPKRNKFCWSTF